MITVPQAFFQSENIEVLFRSGNNAYLKKSAAANNPDNDRYVAAHALTVVEEGDLLLRIPDGPTVKVAAGSMVLIPKGIYMISDIIPASGAFEAKVCFFTPELVAAFVKEVGIGKVESLPGPTIISSKNKNLDSYFHAITKAHKEMPSPYVEWKLKELLLLLMNIQEDLRELIGSLNNVHKEGIQPFMERNFDKPLKLDDYAALTGRSVASFHRDFKRQFGIAPKTWLTQRRMNLAKYRLENEDISVQELAFSNGYDSVSHFIKSFQRHFGISPKQLQLEVKGRLKV